MVDFSAVWLKFLMIYDVTEGRASGGFRSAVKDETSFTLIGNLKKR